MALLKETESEAGCTNWCSNSLQNGSMIRLGNKLEKNDIPANLMNEASCEIAKCPKYSQGELR
jgi:hypothetical protein